MIRRFESFSFGWVKIAKSEDFIEYKKKEDSKWKQRAQSMGFRFPIFKDEEDFRNSINRAEVINLDEYRNKIHHMTSIKDMNQLRQLVKSYQKPRDIDRIIDGIQNGDKIPMPIILKGEGGLFIMAGNTRQNVAYILGVPVEAILIDVTK
jgi:hypothetical protein